MLEIDSTGVCHDCWLSFNEGGYRIQKIGNVKLFSIKTWWKCVFCEVVRINKLQGRYLEVVLFRFCTPEQTEVSALGFIKALEEWYSSLKFLFRASFCITNSKSSLATTVLFLSPCPDKVPAIPTSASVIFGSVLPSSAVPSSFLVHKPLKQQSLPTNLRTIIFDFSSLNKRNFYKYTVFLCFTNPLWSVPYDFSCWTIVHFLNVLFLPDFNCLNEFFNRFIVDDRHITYTWENDNTFMLTLIDVIFHSCLRSSEKRRLNKISETVYHVISVTFFELLTVIQLTQLVVHLHNVL